MKKPVIVLTFIGIAYWYWTGPFENSADTPRVDNTKQNAEIMQRCISDENFATADGSRRSSESAEEVCADQYSFYKMDGKWYQR